MSRKNAGCYQTTTFQCRFVASVADSLLNGPVQFGNDYEYIDIAFFGQIILCGGTEKANLLRTKRIPKILGQLGKYTSFVLRQSHNSIILISGNQ